MQDPFRHDQIESIRTDCGFRGCVADSRAEEASSISMMFARRIDVMRIEVEADVVDTRRQILQQGSGSTTDVQDAHRARRLQKLFYESFSHGSCTEHCLETLIDRGTVQDAIQAGRAVTQSLLPRDAERLMMYVGRCSLLSMMRIRYSPSTPTLNSKRPPMSTIAAKSDVHPWTLTP